MIFTARQLQEKCQKQNVDLYMTFLTLTKHLTQSVVRDFGMIASGRQVHLPWKHIVKNCAHC